MTVVCSTALMTARASSTVFGSRSKYESAPAPRIAICFLPMFSRIVDSALKVGSRKIKARAFRAPGRAVARPSDTGGCGGDLRVLCPELGRRGGGAGESGDRRDWLRSADAATADRCTRARIASVSPELDRFMARASGWTGDLQSGALGLMPCFETPAARL